MGSWVLVLLLGSGPSRAGTPTPTGGDSGAVPTEPTEPTDPGTGTGTGTEIEDTAPPFCPDCVSAGDLAQEKGGTPCEDGGACSAAGPGLLGWIWVPALISLRRKG